MVPSRCVGEYLVSVSRSRSIVAMDPRRSVIGHPPTLPLHHGFSSVAARTPRATNIEPFEQDVAPVPPSVRPSPRHNSMVKRASLSAVQYGSTIPSAELLTVSLMPSSSATTTCPGVDVRKSVQCPPSEFLESLRAKTLLDYDFMREFSLAKRKPIEDRNLSRMSANSVYSMRMAQMELEEQAQRLQRLQLPPAKSITQVGTKAEAEIRAVAPSSTVANQQSDTSKQPPISFRRSSVPASQPSQEEASSCFPTLWRPSDTVATGGGEGILKLKYRRPQPPQSTVASASTSSLSKPITHKHSGHEKVAAPSGTLFSDGLSDFVLRKCHPTSSVTAQHGFLQEQDLPKLLEETGYDRTELYGLWARFKALCAIAKSPKGIDKDTFRRGIPQLSVEDQFFIDRVFDILDADGSGILEWQEFVEALSALEKGDVAKRVGFLFRVYDLNGNGCTIHRTEVMQFFLTSLLVETTDELVEVAKHFVGKIFEAVGCGDVDTMRIEDALRYMREHPSADIYSLFGRTMVTKQRTTGIAESFHLQKPVRARPEGN